MKSFILILFVIFSCCVAVLFTSILEITLSVVSPVCLSSTSTTQYSIGKKSSTHDRSLIRPAMNIFDSTSCFLKFMKIFLSLSLHGVLFKPLYLPSVSFGNWSSYGHQFPLLFKTSRLMFLTDENSTSQFNISSLTKTNESDRLTSGNETHDFILIDKTNRTTAEQRFNTSISSPQNVTETRPEEEKMPSFSEWSEKTLADKERKKKEEDQKKRKRGSGSGHENENLNSQQSSSITESGYETITSEHENKHVNSDLENGGQDCSSSVNLKVDEKREDTSTQSTMLSGGHQQQQGDQDGAKVAQILSQKDNVDSSPVTSDQRHDGNPDRVKSPPHTGGEVVESLNLKNFASPECGAKVIDSNHESKSASNVISSAKDEYMLNVCGAQKQIWFVVELCDSMLADNIQIANFELYSSSPKNMEVWLSNVYPAQDKDWTLFGKFEANENQRSVQTFQSPLKLSKRSKKYTGSLTGKYVKVIVNSFYGSEHYCPISLFKMFGISEIEVFAKYDEIDDNDDDDGINDIIDQKGVGEKDDSSENFNDFHVKQNSTIGSTEHLTGNSSTNGQIDDKSFGGAEKSTILTPCNENCTTKEEIKSNIVDKISELNDEKNDGTSSEIVQESEKQAGIVSKIKEKIKQVVNVVLVNDQNSSGDKLRNETQHKVESVSTSRPPRFCLNIEPNSNQSNSCSLKLDKTTCDDLHTLLTSKLDQLSKVKFKSSVAFCSSILKEKITPSVFGHGGFIEMLSVCLAKNGVQDLSCICDVHTMKEFTIFTPNVTENSDGLLTENSSENITSSSKTNVGQSSVNENVGSGNGITPTSSVWQKLSFRIKNLERNVTLSSGYLEELSLKYRKQIESLQISVRSVSESVKHMESVHIEEMEMISSLKTKLHSDQMELREALNSYKDATSKLMFSIFATFFVFIFGVITSFLVLRQKQRNISLNIDKSMQMFESKMLLNYSTKLQTNDHSTQSMMSKSSNERVEELFPRFKISSKSTFHHRKSTRLQKKKISDKRRHSVVDFLTYQKRRKMSNKSIKMKSRQNIISNAKDAHKFFLSEYDKRLQQQSYSKRCLMNMSNGEASILSDSFDISDPASLILNRSRNFTKRHRYDTFPASTCSKQEEFRCSSASNSLSVDETETGVMSDWPSCVLSSTPNNVRNKNGRRMRNRSKSSSPVKPDSTRVAMKCFENSVARLNLPIIPL